MLSLDFIDKWGCFRRKAIFFGKYEMLHEFAFHLCTGLMLIFSEAFQF